MKRSDLDRKINKILNEEETFLLSLILLSHMQEDDKYNKLSEMIFLFDNYKGFKQFIKYYEGQTIQIPTVKELKQTLRLLELFQKVEVDKKDFDECYTNLKLSTLDLSKDYCKQELQRFTEYLYKNGDITLKQIRRLTKNK